MTEPDGGSWRRNTGTGDRTAKAVAERAGVSVTTVSRVLNGRDGEITARTRDRVLAAARELGYRPNSLAAALRRGVTNTIGLVVPDISDAYFHNVARGVEDVARSAGYMVILCDTDRVADRERDYVELLQDKRVDGIIFCGGGIGDEAHLGGLSDHATHVVTIGPHELSFPSVRTDDRAAMREMVQHLAAQQSRRVLCLAGQADWQVSRQRMLGYRDAITQNGLEDDPNLVVHGDFHQESGYQMTREKLADHVDFDGIVGFNDYVAIGAMVALQEAGLRIPDDVAVAGCDDISTASLVNPALTSIGFPQYEFGRTAMQKILALAKEQPVSPTTTFPYRLETRASSCRRDQR